MSTKEQIYNMIDTFSKSQLPQIYNMILSVKKMLDNEADDKFCRQLYNEYLNDPDPDKDEAVPLDKFADELGIILE